MVNIQPKLTTLISIYGSHVYLKHNRAFSRGMVFRVWEILAGGRPLENRFASRQLDQLCGISCRVLKKHHKDIDKIIQINIGISSWSTCALFSVSLIEMPVEGKVQKRHSV